MPTAQPNYARVRRRVFKLADLQPAPYNPRSITQEAMRGLAESLSRFGLLALPIVNVATKPPRIVGGHQRVSALIDQGVEEAECIVVELDSKKEKQANVAMNNPHIEGSFVTALTRELLEEIATATAGAVMPELRLDQLLKQVIRDAEQTAADRVVKKGKTDDDHDVQLTQSTASSKPGHIYALGQHRLFCGKLSEPGNLKPFQVDAAAMAFTSLTNLPTNASAELVDVLLRHTVENTDGAFYLPVGDVMLPFVQARMVECGGYWSNTIVVHGDVEASKKHPFNESALRIIYGWRNGEPHGFFGGRDQGNAWKLKGGMVSAVPVEAVVRAILNSSTTGGKVLDAHADGGSTVIACEKTGRQCLGYASSPRETDRIRRRWTHFVHGQNADWKALTVKV